MGDQQDDKKGEDPCTDGDSLTLGPDVGGVRPFVRHHADHHVELGLAKVADPSKPLPEGSLQLKHRQGCVYDVRGEVATTSSKGPPKVTSAAYRSNYDNIFGNKTTVGQA